MANARLRRHLGRALLLTPPTPTRAGQFIASAWLLAVAGIWASLQVHAGAHEHVELSPLVHLLRDASLAVPLAAIAIALGGLISGDVVGAFGIRPDSAAARLVWALTAALVFAALSVPGNEMHGALFGAEGEEGDVLVDLLFDASVVLAASLAVLAPLSLTRVAPWPPDAADDLQPVLLTHAAALRPGTTTPQS